MEDSTKSLATIKNFTSTVQCTVHVPVNLQEALKVYITLSPTTHKLFVKIC